MANLFNTEQSQPFSRAQLPEVSLHIDFCCAGYSAIFKNTSEGRRHPRSLHLQPEVSCALLFCHTCCWPSSHPCTLVLIGGGACFAPSLAPGLKDLGVEPGLWLSTFHFPGCFCSLSQSVEPSLSPLSSSGLVAWPLLLCINIWEVGGCHMSHVVANECYLPRNCPLRVGGSRPASMLMGSSLTSFVACWGPSG